MATLQGMMTWYRDVSNRLAVFIRHLHFIHALMIYSFIQLFEKTALERQVNHVKSGGADGARVSHRFLSPGFGVSGVDDGGAERLDQHLCGSLVIVYTAAQQTGKPLETSSQRKTANRTKHDCDSLLLSIICESQRLCVT